MRKMLQPELYQSYTSSQDLILHTLTKLKSLHFCHFFLQFKIHYLIYSERNQR